MKIFQWSDAVYDRVKFIAIHVIPAAEMFWGILASVWKLPYGTEIGATIGGFGLFVAMCLGFSKAEYEKEKAQVVEESEG